MGIDLAFNRRRINNLWNDGLICNQNPDKCTNFNNFIGALSSHEKSVCECKISAVGRVKAVTAI